VWGCLGASLDDALRQRLFSEAHRLAHLIVHKQLVYFIGAGLSLGAGLPDWKGLIDTLAREAHMTPAEHKALSNFPFLDGARVISNRLASQGRSLGEVVASMIKSELYTVSHALLSGAGPKLEAISTNYDLLIERSRKAVGVTIPVIPNQHGTDQDSGPFWLLKLHGCVTRPQDIVLSRDHYLGMLCPAFVGCCSNPRHPTLFLRLEYDSNRSALAGIAQTKLLTKHLCFFGFSLTDDNFQKIISAVRVCLFADLCSAKTITPTHASLVCSLPHPNARRCSVLV
jgi:hypothetical protein